MAMISYPSANEDVLLFDALRQVPAEAGFYIDVGANDPEKDSVTKLIYEQGWHGIKIEPSPEWESRGRDINIQAAALNKSGEIMSSRRWSRIPLPPPPGLGSASAGCRLPVRVLGRA